MILFDENCTSQLKGLCFADPRTSKDEWQQSYITQQLRPDFDTAKRFTGGSEYHYVSLSCTGM